MKIDINRYLGKWFEIARIPASFEPNMTGVTAEYSINKDGNIQVINSGYVNGDLRRIAGIVTLTDKDDLLKVSFFPGKKSDYKILAIDKDYQLVVVGGGSSDFLWILARNPRIFKEEYDKLVQIAKKYKYNTDKLEITKY